MAKYRQIHVKIWKDNWFLELEPTDKLFFIYLFSNERASIAGLYELPEKVMAFESGLTRQEIKEAFDRFSATGKAFYEDGVVWVKNLRKYHETPSSKLQKGIENDLDEVKDCPLKECYLAHYGYTQAPEDDTDLPEDDTDSGISGSDNRVSEGADRVFIPSNSSSSSLDLVSDSSGKGGVGEKPEPVHSSGLAADYQKAVGDMTDALAEAVQIDIGIDKNRDKVELEAIWLVKAGYTAAQVLAGFGSGGYWYMISYGRNGRPPELGNIRSEIKRAVEWFKNGKPMPSPNGRHPPDKPEHTAGLKEIRPGVY